ncbi:MAG TPA: NAD(P)H-binding protein, partial [Sphingomonas sp.]
MPHALIIGAGQIGRAVAETLLDRGWSATLASRSGGLPAEFVGRGATAVSLDRTEPGALARALGSGADLLLDTVAFDAADADQLIELSGDAGRIVAISSTSVYRDPAGRTLDEARENGFPDLPER